MYVTVVNAGFSVPLQRQKRDSTLNPMPVRLHVYKLRLLH